MNKFKELFKKYNFEKIFFLLAWISLFSTIILSSRVFFVLAIIFFISTFICLLETLGGGINFKGLFNFKREVKNNSFLNND